jgi:hypothetical protein
MAFCEYGDEKVQFLGAPRDIAAIGRCRELGSRLRLRSSTEAPTPPPWQSRTER